MKLLFIAVLSLVPLVGQAQEFSERAKAAIAKGLPGILRGVDNYPQSRQCFSCHHQALPLMTLSAARTRGLFDDDAKIEELLAFSLASFQGDENHARLRQGLRHRTTVIGYLLATMAALDYPADETTAALVQYMLAREDPTGGWRDALQRPPGQGSSFTVTAVTLWGFRRYGGAEELRALAEPIERAQESGLRWLAEQEPHDTEDKVFQLRGLVVAGADQRKIAACRDQLAQDQRDDGSWSQLPGREGDAYATGSALVALRKAGLAVDDPVFARGVGYLLDTQQADGSWFVATRAKPAQPFFDNGDPGGTSQFMCFAATNWALLALLEGLPPRPNPDASHAPSGN